LKEKRRVFVIGLDGATLDLIKPWVSGGKLPCLGKILREGVCGELRSTIHPLTPQAWASFLTGKNPGKHGIYDFIYRKKDSYDITYQKSSSRHGESIWKIISDTGKKVGVVNIPLNYPPEKVNGFCISWQDASGAENDYMYPRDLVNEIEREVGKYLITVEYKKKKKNVKARYLKDLEMLIDNRALTTEYLMTHKEWDFFIVLFSATDLVQHTFWKYMDKNHPLYDEMEAKKYGDAILNIYKKVDNSIERLLKHIDDDTLLIIMSDHGAGPLYGEIRLNTWLRKNGFLFYRNRNRNLKFHYLINIDSIVRSSWSLLRKLTSKKLRGLLKNMFPHIREKLEGTLFSSNIDWKKTAAYSLGTYGNIFVNLKGREPEGIVNSGLEYEQVRDKIICLLEALTHPQNGKRIVAKVYKREELYKGEFLGKAPDLIVQWRDYAYHSRQRFGEESDKVFETRLFSPLSDFEINGFHRLNGMLIMKGKQIQRNMEISGANILDLAPTILYFMGIPIPDDMDGKVLLEVFDDRFSSNNKIQYRSGKKYSFDEKEAVYSQEDLKEIQKRLTELGYL